jgi:excisionase family DNA binding protein
MTDETSEDSWLTLAEIADELRLKPVTIRSWIAKGRLRATRAGQRKWLVRRSDLDAMLAADRGDGSSALPDWHADPCPSHALDEAIEVHARHEQLEHEHELAIANYDWQIALEQSRMAPPDARFVSRIRHIAQAADAQAGAIRDAMDDPDFELKPVADSDGMTLSYELRPGGNRPGPADAWGRVDRVVTRLGKALGGTSAESAATAFSDLARALNDVADAIGAGARIPNEAVRRQRGE